MYNNFYVIPNKFSCVRVHRQGIILCMLREFERSGLYILERGIKPNPATRRNFYSTAITSADLTLMQLKLYHLSGRVRAQNEKNPPQQHINKKWMFQFSFCRRIKKKVFGLRIRAGQTLPSYVPNSKQTHSALAFRLFLFALKPLGIFFLTQWMQKRAVC